MGVSPIELLPFKYNHFPLNHDYGRKSRGEINTHHMFFKVTTTRRKHLLWQRLAFFQIQLDVYPFVLCFASRRSFAIKTRDIWVPGIYIAPKVSKHGTCENSSHFESRDCFLFPFSVGLNQHGNYPHTLEVGKLQIERVFSDPSMTTSPANVIRNHGNSRGSFPNL